MKLAISEITTLKSDLQTDIAAFADAGWTAIELSIEKADIFLAKSSIEELGALLKSRGLKPVAAIGLAPKGPGLFLARGEAFNEYMSSLTRQIRMCEELGIPCLGIGADPARYSDGGNWIDGAVENVRSAAKVAGQHGITIGIESLSLDPPIGPFLLESLNETREFVERVDRANVGINFDVFHYIRSGGTLADIEATRPGQIIHAHICDLPKMTPKSWLDSHRVMPGEGSLDLTSIRDALLASGFNGYWALELLNEDYWAKDARDVARIGKAAMEKFAA